MKKNLPIKKDQKNLIVICGPTASGKTTLAVSIADCYNGEIISADSRQVYRGMDIGTGKDLEEYETHTKKIPYHLIDITDPSDIYTLYHYQQDCFHTIKELWGKRMIPVIAGGTGLYIEAVLKHYKIPNVSEDSHLRSELMKKEKRELQEQLKLSDPDLYKSIDLTSKKRIVRAIEIVEYKKHHEIQYGVKNPPSLFPLIIGIKWPRELLKERINKRLEKRFDEGMINEVKELQKSGVTSERLELFGMEYKYIVRYLKGRLTYVEMVNSLSSEINRLAKRQMTYFRGFERRGLPIYWIDRADKDKTLEIIKKYHFKYE